MKRVLIVSCEETPASPGRIPHSAQYGLPQEISDIPNLCAVVRMLGDYDVYTLHHTAISRWESFQPDYVILSGRFSPQALSREDMACEYRALIDWIPATSVPVLGICMGLQLICAAYGVTTRRLDDPAGEYGFAELRRVSGHPLLEKAGETFSVLELHRCEAERLPPEFQLLASSDKCRIQMIAHRTRPLAGVQFHPELTTPQQSDGLRILEGFFRAYA